MEFSPQQLRALQSVAHWLESSDQQVFRLFGYAGTGKTTLAKHFAEGVKGTVLFAAFTGKAAHVLQQKGCPASTIHKLIYIPRSKSSARLSELRERLKNTDPDHPMAERLRKAIEAERENLSRPMFQLNLDSPLNRTELLIIDEVSMVNQEMAEDLISFGCKILVLGDPAQLPPVYGAGYFIQAEPDFMLTDIHRQARDNPIIALATQIRNHEVPSLGQYGESSVITKIEMTSDMTMAYDQLLVARNATRIAFNARIRQIMGRPENQPTAGDRVVCLRNDHEVGLLNGGLWEIEEAYLSDDPDDATVHMSIVPEEGGDSMGVEAHLCYFLGQKPEWWDKDKAQEFDYGYALTCHKAQGSQWDDVIVYDERMGKGTERFNWLYTAVTRAAEKVCLVR